MRDLKPLLRKRQQQHLYRRRRTVESAQQPVMQVEGQTLLSFCSNDYLGLAYDPQLVTALKQAADEFGTGAGAAHLINGHSHHHHRLEEELASFTGYPRALLFSTGYMANLSVAQALLGPGDAVFQDRLNHASLLDAGILSRARFQRYTHNEPEALDKKLADSKAEEKLVLTDGVFSMDGDLAPIPALAKKASTHRAWLMVDDAHGVGVLGAHGQGSLEHHKLSSMEVPILMGTLGKALGTAGAFVAGSEDLIEYLIQTARPYIYTTAMPAAIAAATRVSLQKVQNEPERRDRLNTLIQRFRLGAEQLGLPLLASQTPIQGVLLGNASTAVSVSQHLLDLGLLVTAIRPPTVPQGTARLRITFSAKHTPENIDRLLEALEQVIPR
ncbi:MAG: 8-amino-7-oxononanoate synthase [bacterium]